LRWSALGVLLAVYAFVSLEPFDWRWPGSIVNAATPLAEGWDFSTAGIVIAAAPLAGLADAVQAETLDVSLEVRPLETEQFGPARILTISLDAYRRNLTVAQDGDDLTVRLRARGTDRNGMRDGKPVAQLADVFEAGKWVAIDLSIRPGSLVIAIDGEQRLATTLPDAVLATWNTRYGLVLGNEMTCNRPWLGQIGKAVVQGLDGAVDYVLDRQLRVPDACRIQRHPPKLVPFYPFYRNDALRNLVMYAPLGCLLGLMARRRSRRSFGLMVLAVAGVSLTFETAQLFLVTRYPSVDDLIFNTLGGTLGVGLGFWLMKVLAAVRPVR
jgi:VanZ family protein